MAIHTALALFVLLLHSSAASAHSLLHGHDALPLRLHKLRQPSLKHNFLLDIAHNESDTQLTDTVLPVSSKHIVKRLDSSSLPSFDETTFNENAATACADAVSNYTEAVNPSGMVACYNIAAWNNTTGVFQTDVRLYQKSAAVGMFEGISASNYSMSFSIAEATVSSPMNMDTNGSSMGNTTDAQFVMGFQNIGQLTKSLHFSKLTDADLRVLMIPSMSLSAQTSMGTTVNTSLASDMLSYVAGELTQATGSVTNITTPQAATLASPIIAAATVFTYPGTHIKTYPSGLIMSCIWTGLLFIAVGGGTIGRYQFRMVFRKRVQQSTAAKNSAWLK